HNLRDENTWTGPPNPLLPNACCYHLFLNNRPSSLHISASILYVTHTAGNTCSRHVNTRTTPTLRQANRRKARRTWMRSGVFTSLIGFCKRATFHKPASSLSGKRSRKPEEIKGGTHRHDFRMK
ncbi:unnamed protein product, partial [Ectocarpus sp. 13 AM-2016]